MRHAIWHGLALTVCLLSTATAWAAADSTVDGTFAGGGPVSPGVTTNLTVIGRGGVPNQGVASVALNVTVTNTTMKGYLTVWPTGRPRPATSNVNFGTLETVPNMVIVPVGDGGQVSIFSPVGTVDLVVDMLGWFSTDVDFKGLTPAARLMDTRPLLPTVDDQQDGGGSIGAQTTTNVSVANRGGVPTIGAYAVALNVTVTNPSAASFLTVWPTGEEQPAISNLNFVAGQTVANMVLVRLGQGGQISIFNQQGSTDLVVDVLGWFPGARSFNGVMLARLMDTRSGSSTVDQLFAGAGALGPAEVRDLGILGRPVGLSAGLGRQVGAVAVNVTVTNPSAASYLTVWPSGTPRPATSNLNFVPGQTIANMVLVPIGNGGLSIFNAAGTADVIVDLLGYSIAGVFDGSSIVRLMDTRA